MEEFSLPKNEKRTKLWWFIGYVKYLWFEGYTLLGWNFKNI